MNSAAPAPVAGRRFGRLAGRLSRLLPALAPEWLLSVAADGSTATYRLRTHWDGRQSLEAQAIPAGRKCIAVIDGNWPYRRRLQRIPEAAGARQAMLKTAPDEFPLAREELRFAMGIGSGSGYLYAFPQAEIERLRTAGFAPVAVLVGNAPLAPDDCLEALEQYGRYGAITSFLPATATISRSRLRLAALSLSLLLLGGLASWLLLSPKPLLQIAERERTRLQQEVGDLPRLHAATETMIASANAMARLAVSPEAKAARILALAVRTVPPGCSISRIEIKAGRLEIGGVGSEVRGWLTEAGFQPDSIEIEKVTGTLRFRAAAKLEES